MSRIIGVTHRVKKTKEGAARPTLVCILEESGKAREYKLETETDEFDFFVRGLYPVAYRGAMESDDLTLFLEHQLKGKKGSEEIKVPVEFDGLRQGDLVAMPLGGSGNYLAYAIARRGQALKARLFRLKPSTLKERRGNGPKDRDHELLARLAKEGLGLFHEVHEQDLGLIRLQVALRQLTEAMKARIACEQRLQQLVIGQVFVSDGKCPEGTIEKAFLAAKASNTILANLEAEETTRQRDLERALDEVAVYGELFEPIKGVGPRIAARLIASIGDIKLFPTDAKLKSFCGARPTSDGKFLRRRAGEVANWSPEARQALWLLGDQFNRRPETVWGQKLREYKAKLRAAHPEVVMRENSAGKLVKCYTDGHIHKMAIWRTLSKFVEWLWREWTRLEGERSMTKPKSEADAA